MDRACARVVQVLDVAQQEQLNGALDCLRQRLRGLPDLPWLNLDPPDQQVTRLEFSRRPALVTTNEGGAAALLCAGSPGHLGQARSRRQVPTGAQV